MQPDVTENLTKTELVKAKVSGAHHFISFA